MWLLFMIWAVKLMWQKLPLDPPAIEIVTMGKSWLNFVQNVTPSIFTQWHQKLSFGNLFGS